MIKMPSGVYGWNDHEGDCKTRGENLIWPFGMTANEIFSP